MNEVYRHKKRDSRYTIVGDAEFQLSGEGPIIDGDSVVVYRSQETGKIYVRLRSEFHDGRFEKLWPRK
jgi:hypothetical protein